MPLTPWHWWVDGVRLLGARPREWVLEKGMMGPSAAEAVPQLWIRLFRQP